MIYKNLTVSVTEGDVIALDGTVFTCRGPMIDGFMFEAADSGRQIGASTMQEEINRATCVLVQRS